MDRLLTASGLLCPSASYGKFVRRALWGGTEDCVSVVLFGHVSSICVYNLLLNGPILVCFYRK